VQYCAAPTLFRLPTTVGRCADAAQLSQPRCAPLVAASAAKGKAQPAARQPRKLASALSLAEWQASASTAHVGARYSVALAAMQRLADVDGGEVAAGHPGALRAALRLLAHGYVDKGMRKATFVDAFATAVAAHPALLEAMRKSANVRKVVANALELRCSGPAGSRGTTRAGAARDGAGQAGLVLRALLARRHAPWLAARRRSGGRHSLLRHGCDIRRMRKATIVDTYAKAMEAHPTLLRGVHTLPKLRAAVAEALDAAARDPQTYTNGLCAVQISTAQVTLQLYCKDYWHELERKGVEHAGARQVATIAHRACILASQHGAPPPTSALWAQLENGIERTAADMEAQHVSNCLWACSKVEHAPGDAARGALLAALPLISGDMVAQNASNTLWALATLRIAIDGEVREALLAAVVRTSRSMNEQQVANTLWALAHLQVPLEDELHEALLRAALRESSTMNDQNVANTLWALEQLKVPLEGELREALLRAALRESSTMIGQGVANTLWALEQLQVPLEGDLRGALLGATLRESSTMNGQGVANTLWTLAQLQVPLEGELRDAPLAAAEHTSGSMNGQGVASTLLALAKLAVALEGQLREALLAAALRTSGSMTAQGVANTLLALAKLAVPLAGELRDALLAAVLGVKRCNERPSSCQLRLGARRARRPAGRGRAAGAQRRARARGAPRAGGSAHDAPRLWEAALARACRGGARAAQAPRMTCSLIFDNNHGPKQATWCARHQQQHRAGSCVCLCAGSESRLGRRAHAASCC
jgi:hypothetical protein